MIRDPRIDPQPGDVLVFQDKPVLSLAIIERVGEDGMVAWTEGLPLAIEREEWVEHCRGRKATILEGDGPLSLFRWRPGGARGGELPEAEVGEILFWSNGLLLIGKLNYEYQCIETRTAGYAWRCIEWWVPVSDLLPKESTP